MARGDGPPLVFLAPRQATFQLERQLLEAESLRGYTRLQIVSFQRLARFVFEQLNVPLPSLLGEEGRVMVLRALIADGYESLAAFRQSARRPGFAEELSRQIREFQNYGLSPAELRKLAEDAATPGRLAGKLRDLALLYEMYRDWLDASNLRDGDALLEIAAELLDRTPRSGLRIAGLWFDGFAQLTPQERKVLLGLLPFCEEATLAFCLDKGAVVSPISHWKLVEGTYNQVHGEIIARLSQKPEIITLGRDPARSRFAGTRTLGVLEEKWGDACAREEISAPELDEELLVVECREPEGEAVFCAREIIRHVRGGGRYREAAVLLRDFDHGYPDVLRRVFVRYGIPYFIDHREGVAHHPLAELTRGALRTLAFKWRIEDWFCALKSGLVGIHPDELDALENEALAHGWEGASWETGFKIANDAEKEKRCNELRERSTRPFLALARDLGQAPTGRQLCDSIREFWKALGVQDQLDKWAAEENHPVHQTVWEQMSEWLENVALAFEERRMSLREWLPILEAGLGSLTVGQVPPVLDQVLIGTVDRSRNPDLKLLFIMGLNEGIFPAPPNRAHLVNEREREILLAAGCELPSLPASQLAGEQFYGYIACTRARQRLVLSYAQTASDGTALNPSRFVGQIRRSFPNLQLRHWNGPEGADDLQHLCELLPSLGSAEEINRFFGDAPPGAVADFTERFAGLRVPDPDEQLQPEIAAALYREELHTSVSALEKFAACPFQFFVAHGLRAEERKQFKLDVREQGHFQHQVLERFHEGILADGRKWRDLTVEEAQARIRAAAEEILPEFHGGLLCANEQNQFTAHSQTEMLTKFMAAVIRWFEANAFDPEIVELPFGDRGRVPGWRIELENGKALVLGGRVDRLDIFREGERGCVIIMDYKSGKKEPDKVLLHHGIQQQLPAYLLAITRMEETRALLGVEEVAGAGVFFVPLRPKLKTGETRIDALANREQAGSRAFTHSGFFDLEFIEKLDGEWAEDGSGQFTYSINNDGSPRKKSFNALPTEKFQRLLARTEELLRDFGRRIYAGETAIRPYKHKQTPACERCDFVRICRFDSWSQRFNVLSMPPEEPE